MNLSFERQEEPKRENVGMNPSKCIFSIYPVEFFLKLVSLLLHTQWVLLKYGKILTSPGRPTDRPEAKRLT